MLFIKRIVSGLLGFYLLYKGADIMIISVSYLVPGVMLLCLGIILLVISADGII